MKIFILISFLFIGSCSLSPEERVFISTIAGVYTATGSIAEVAVLTIPENGNFLYQNNYYRFTSLYRPNSGIYKVNNSQFALLFYNKDSQTLYYLLSSNDTETGFPSEIRESDLTLIGVKSFN